MSDDVNWSKILKQTTGNSGNQPKFGTQNVNESLNPQFGTETVERGFGHTTELFENRAQSGKNKK